MVIVSITFTSCINFFGKATIKTEFLCVFKDSIKVEVQIGYAGALSSDFILVLYNDSIIGTADVCDPIIQKVCIEDNYINVEYWDMDDSIHTLRNKINCSNTKLEMQYLNDALQPDSIGKEVTK